MMETENFLNRNEIENLFPLAKFKSMKSIELLVEHEKMIMITLSEKKQYSKKQR
jgi:hypothetical protein